MDYEFTFILPCLNEEKTLEYCIKEIQEYIHKNNLNAEILVADNNSTDKSVEIAKKHNARVIIQKEKGYGNALIAGTNNAYGKYCIMGDSDGSYDFSHLDDFVKNVRNGYDLVVGNRFLGGIEPNAMPFSHSIGSRALTEIANLFFHTKVHDFHCGLRAYNTIKIRDLKLNKGGMEYASEMIIKAKINNLSIIEVPTILRKDLRDRKPHLRTIRDGFRHLFFIFSMLWSKKK